MAKKTRTELSTLAINTNLPDNTTELITPTTERSQLTDERESVVNYKDDLGGVSNAGKFITVATDGESLTMVDEPTGELSGTGDAARIAFWSAAKVLTYDDYLSWNTSTDTLNAFIVNATSKLIAAIINSPEGNSITLSTQPTGGTLTPRLTITSGGDANFSDGVNVNGSTLGGTLSVTGEDGVYAAIFKGGTTVGSSYGPYIRAGSNSSDIAFQVRDVTEADLFFRITGDGSVLIPNGVVFNNNSVTGDKTSVTLNDYEEGTWTGTMLNTGTSPNPTSTGTYVRIGDLVHVQIYFVSFITTAGTARVSGLPFSVGGSASIGYGLISYMHGDSISNCKGGYVYQTEIYNMINNGTAASTWVVGQHQGMWSGTYKIN